MTTMRELFSSQIDRRIEKVIDYAAREDDRLLAEISEYEATDNVETCFRKFLENYQMGVQGGRLLKSESGYPAFTDRARAPSPSIWVLPGS